MQEQGLALGPIGGGSTRDHIAASGRGEMNSDHHQQQRYDHDHNHQQMMMLKAEIATHPLYEQLLSSHVSCLRVATPIDQLPLLDNQLAQSTHLLRSYASMAASRDRDDNPHQSQELNSFLTQYMLLLCSFKEQLQHHVRVDAVEAVLACREIEHSLQSLTGATIGEGSGGTMSDDEEDDRLENYSMEQSIMSGESQYNHNSLDLLGFGSLHLSETERTLMERVRHELKLELKQGFKSRIEDVREEIMRKRRAGKLPGDTTSMLKEWWDQHAKWPYPTEDDKAKLVEETGLQLKQINNWFINQRKRNWHRTNSNSSTSLKSKRRR